MSDWFIDFNRADILRRRRRVAVIAFLAHFAAVICTLWDVYAPAIVLVSAEAAIFIAYILTYTSELEQMRLVDDHKLSYRRKEDFMKP